MLTLKERKSGENVRCWPGNSGGWYEEFQGKKVKILLRSQDSNFKIHLKSARGCPTSKSSALKESYPQLENKWGDKSNYQRFTPDFRM